MANGALPVLSRLFGSEMGSQISWLLPAALVLLVVVLVADLEAATHGPAAASMVLWGGWLIVTGLVFSLAQGIIHPYYTVALAPAIGAIVGIGGGFLWSRRSALWARVAMGSIVVGSSVWAAVLLDRVPTWHPWLRTAILVGGLCRGRAHRPFPLSGTAFPGPGGPDRCARTGGPGRPRRSLLIHSGHRRHSAFGGDPVGRPVIGRPGRVPRTGWSGFGPDPAAGGRRAAVHLRPAAGSAASARAAQAAVVVNCRRALATGNRRSGGGQFGSASGGGTPGFSAPNRQGGPGAGVGGLLNSSTPSAAITSALRSNASRYTWVAALVGSNEAAGYQLAAGEPVMAIGGFNGTDPAPTLAQFEKYVKDKKIHYFIATGSGFGAIRSRE